MISLTLNQGIQYYEKNMMIRGMIAITSHKFHH
jgi:hypothetical protein